MDSQQLQSMEKPLLSEESTIQQPPKIAMGRAIIFLTNIITGIGLLGIPYCFRSGVGTNLIVIIFIAAISYFSFVCLIDSAAKSGVSDYYNLMSVSFGKPRFNIIPQLTTIIVLFGVNIIYAQFSCKIIQAVLDEIKGVPSWCYSRWFLVFASVGLITFPITMLKSVGALSYVSMSALVIAVCYIIHDVVMFAKQPFDPQHQLKIFTLNNIFIPSLAIQCTSFTCHPFIFGTLGQMQSNTPKRQAVAMFFSTLAATVLYILGGIFPYLTLFDGILDSVILSYYPKGEVFTIIIKALYSILLLLTSPNLLFFMRQAFDAMIFQDRPMTTFRWILEGGGILLCAALIAINVQSVNTIFSFIGGLACPVMSYIIPAIYYIRICKRDSMPKFIMAWCLLVIGVAFIVICMYDNIRSLAK
ncbi:Transmembrane amino acid transporter protein [Histomonas meleagridis]|uniref:Transmembrane amino acid transporter protein n=1 Tax=Histomonas meleagridis TaxID=135588 RepID=UPI00355AB0F3|nr:Transmembrane amino acid transporter protein [Histomonas meleagridis]KAH0797837.1 Transmembrane amino acid transporter protein [Histomonas meleagridis]